MNHKPATAHQEHSAIYWLIILSALAVCTGRIFSVSGKENVTPFLSSNDKSRWCTIRALVDHGTYVIDDIILETDENTGKLTKIKGWYPIDLVRHRGHDGREHYYSSKPVLMPTLMAGVYGTVKLLTGVSLEKQPYHAGRLVLWICNIPPLLIMWWLLMKLIHAFTQQLWTGLFMLLAVTWGTFITTYAVTLNNHLHAAVCVTITIYWYVTMKQGGTSLAWWKFFIAGIFAMLTVANELPALAFAGLMGFAFLTLNWQRTLLGFVPGALLVAVAMTGLNYVAHGTWKPPYSQRKDGPIFINTHVTRIDHLRLGSGTELAHQLGWEPGIVQLKPRLPFQQGDDVTDQWSAFNLATHERYAIRLLNEATGSLEVRHWGNWYEYEGTYWTAAVKSGVDVGESSPLTYVFHCLVGHHGLFSLTPIWLFSLLGMLVAVRQRFTVLSNNSSSNERMLGLGELLLITCLLSMICLAFYFSRPIYDRNYGGMCNGLRWMIWFTPLYLLAMLPCVEQLAKSFWGRSLAIGLLCLSMFSAAYKNWNPWVHPWLYDYWEYLEYIAYP